MQLMSRSFGHGQRMPQEFAFGAPDPEQRVDDATAVARGGDAGDRRGPRAGEEAHEDRFGLVVGGVTERGHGATAPGEAEEEADADLPRQLLEGAAAA